jgi:hypothetical protein
VNPRTVGGSASSSRPAACSASGSPTTGADSRSGT